MKNLLICIVCVVVLFSCKKAEEKAIAYPKDINFVTIATSRMNSKPKFPSSRLTITNQIDWAIFIGKIDSFYNISNKFTTTSLDFSTNQLLVAIDSVRNTQGWSIDILNVKEYQNNVEVTVDNLYKGNNALTVIQPLLIVQIPKQTKPIVFK